MIELNQTTAGDITKDTRPLTIDVVTETYPPEINGVAHTLSMLVQALRRNGHRVSVVRPKQPSDSLIEANHYSHADYLVRSLPIPLYNELRMGMPSTKKLINRWTTRRPDIVHLATEGPLGWSAVRAAKKLSIPITSDFRTNFHAYSTFYKIGFLKSSITRYLRWIHNSTHRTMTPTATLRKELIAEKFLNVSVIPRGVDVASFSPTYRSEVLRAKWGVRAEDVVLLSVGRLALEKNLELVLQSYDAAKLKVPTVRLVIVGDGPMKETLKQKCPNALFVGVKRGVELAQHFASADMFVFPSLTETFGNVTIEAMASGLTVIAFHHAAAGELISTGLNGITVEPDNEKAFIRAVATTAADTTMMRSLAQAAVITTAGLSWAAIAQQTECIFREVIEACEKEYLCHDNFIVTT